MRWLIKNNKKINIVNKELNIGDCKIKVKFAFLPVKIKIEKIWLERYIEIYEYKEKIVTNSEKLLTPTIYVTWVFKEKIIYDTLRVKQFNKL